MSDVKLIKASELLTEPLPTDLELAKRLIRVAANILDGDPQRIGSATWRLADALGLLAAQGDDLPGIHHATGRCVRLVFIDAEPVDAGEREA